MKHFWKAFLITMVVGGTVLVLLPDAQAAPPNVTSKSKVECKPPATRQGRGEVTRGREPVIRDRWCGEQS